MEIIKLEDIKKTYDLGKVKIEVLKGIDITILKNEYVAIMGPSGSGKSTLMNLLGCLDKPTSGKYTLNNKLVSTMSENELAEVRNKEIGFVFQTFNLMARLTAVENVALPLIYAAQNKTKRTAQATEVLNAVGLSHRLTHKPNELSGGERQRVAVARALVNNPSIILADEPTGNLDTRTSYEIMELFEEIHKQGNTVIIVTHEEDIARYAHRIIRLRDGMIEKDELNTDKLDPKELRERLQPINKS
ncbi:MAG TPA: ABC transporter ATP-binding protein [Chitinophagales bacterium]|nr:ABC transporter ATP-binding protein [Chitinophagales bacterium]